MPFTLSHAAAALPLRHLLRGAAVFPALVIGCFIPDVPYFLPEPFCNINAHYLPGLVLFGIPLGWTIYALWFGLLLEPSVALLPRPYSSLLSASALQHPLFARPWSVTLSLLAGAVSHIVWDAFTHRRGLVVHAWPALAQPVLHVGTHALPPYFVFQHGSTVVGIVCLVLHVRRRLRQVATIGPIAESTPQLKPKHKIAVAAALSVTTAGLVWCTFSSADAPRFSAYNFVCCCISAGAAMTVIYALGWHGYYRRAGRRNLQ
jgi:hypothetical protein